ncbi:MULTISPECIES: hypothetical protein [unclassified Chelatococcus]|uniref:hypothetical protein n=1 Tax=unclassified Chelatococcus TaxID=2638111 RepID=UPI001BD1A047|nr:MULTISPECIES: hypothetical protein [unclassified Chelatococcus]CAH1665512.1 conserved hypothetical protein [Hyphomicrobiales bacterium]MBS7737730.1 hypothetical protein [Chelatococcus sp. HY11]MCO5077142.1 hypothetical protein [Chelatococcus sp.]MCO5079191.1 hypothetical protein [Chelatococcus sp.]CAH1678305.1 conserved hypothetical protein [Hyphomicrobiales bacterium]
MADRPILFSAPMVRALLEGRKTQTRRVLKMRGHRSFSEFGPSDTRGYDWHFRDAAMRWHDLRNGELIKRLSYAIGDRLWVRETWTACMVHGWTIADARSRLFEEEIIYRSDGHQSIDGWWSSIHLPREFSRLTLIVTDVRVQRLQDISEEDAIAEGCGLTSEQVATNNELAQRPPPVHGDFWHMSTGRGNFLALWSDIHGGIDAWDANPWVAAYTFTVHRCNIDQMEAEHAD